MQLRQQLIIYYSREITNNINSYLSLHWNTPVGEKQIDDKLLAIEDAYQKDVK